MTIKQLQHIIVTDARAAALNALVRHRRSRLAGVAGSSAAVMLAAIDDAHPVLVVGDSLDDAGYLYHDMCRMLGDDAVLMLPSSYRRSIKYGQVDAPQVTLRGETLTSWSRPGVRAVVTYPEAMAEQVAAAEELTGRTLTLRQGEVVDGATLEKWLADNRFTRVDYVYEPGQWARRGSIVDIYGYSSELPCRIDFFGDEIETLRTFNVETQLSEKKLTLAAITGERASRGSSTLTDFMPRGSLIAMRDELYVVSRIRALAGEAFSSLALAAGEGDAGAMANLVDPDALEKSLSLHRLLTFTAGNPGDDTPAGGDGTDSRPAGGSDNATHPVTVPTPRGASDDTPLLVMHCSPQGLYHKNFDLIADELSRFLARGYTIDILSDSAGQLARLRDIFGDRGDDIPFTGVEGTLHEGFVDHDGRRCVLTDHQIFDRFHKYTLRSDRARQGKLAMSLKELQAIEPGDYVVHIDHGVGKFGGLVHTSVNGRPQELIKLIYKNNDFILVSIHALHKLSKYRGKEGVEPTINRLGGGAWARVKEKTKSRLKDIARDLIKLYAARRDNPGHAYPPDSYLQQQLEASFVWEDTPDQVTATRAVKADMESPRPMDRLICGDVGFGKTEIAVRAAFKAVCDSRQVAVLVPTTVLAYQHFKTFTERLKEFPVTIEYLSRARTPRQVRDIIKRLQEGKIDILIGTHRIIGKDVRFKDLGLLVIDEEQKFGVSVKERLRQVRTNVDTLTMSATPIPRTLQFSLMGARDLSAITTPPPNRYPIMTAVETLGDDLVQEAVSFELSRNGQVFVINNRIEGLYDLQAMIQRLVPDARTLVAHGQLPPEQLEKAIIDFANHDYDVLLSTTIIESGIDMPNVNTVIVNNAHCFGLSELHQLRGRVGRSSRKAFCYLTVPPGVPLTPVARRRLQAIEGFSDLGSGIHIAMQDLDIRGAGNLLGAEQSGFIADLGYETYQRILREAVTELKNQEFPDLFDDTTAGTQGNGRENDGNGDRGTVNGNTGGSGGGLQPAVGHTDWVVDCSIESDLELLLPPDYVPGDSERIALYRELDDIDSERGLLEFARRLKDRFGPMPAVTAELLRVPRLRMLARSLGIEKVTLKQGRMMLYFVDETNRAYYQSAMFGRLLSYLQENPRRVAIRDKGGKRSFAVADVATVETAVHILQEILARTPL